MSAFFIGDKDKLGLGLMLSYSFDGDFCTNFQICLTTGLIMVDFWKYISKLLFGPFCHIILHFTMIPYYLSQVICCQELNTLWCVLLILRCYGLKMIGGRKWRIGYKVLRLFNYLKPLPVIVIWLFQGHKCSFFILCKKYVINSIIHISNLRCNFINR
jgi:hypothetical protein